MRTMNLINVHFWTYLSLSERLGIPGLEFLPLSRIHILKFVCFRLNLC